MTRRVKKLIVLLATLGAVSGLLLALPSSAAPECGGAMPPPCCCGTCSTGVA